MTAIANLPDLRPSLLLDFANSGRVDPRIQCTRTSTATCWGPDGRLRTVAANVPRIDYDPETGKCLGLLVEEARTNLKTYSRRPQSGTGTAIGTATTIAPDGLPIEAVVETATTGEHYVSDHVISNVLVGDVITQSIFVKKTDAASVREVVLRVAAPNDSGQVRFTIRGDTCTPTAVPPGWRIGYSRCANGWWRVWATWTAAIANTSAVIRIQIHNDAQATYTGDPAQGIFLFGRQIEVGAFPTSYIPTEASAVTRAVDVVYTDDLSWFSPARGTICFETETKRPFSSTGYLAIGTPGPTFETRNSLYVSSGATGFFSYSYMKNGVSQATASRQMSESETLQKFAFSFSTGSSRGYSNSTAMQLSSTFEPASGFTRMGIGCVAGAWSNSTTPVLNGYFKKLVFYPARLPDAQLQRLTA